MVKGTNSSGKVGARHMGHVIMDYFVNSSSDIFQIDAATGEKETAASVLARTIQLARCFRNFGLQPGDVVALGGINHLDLHIPYYAAMLNGLPLVGVDPSFKIYELTKLFTITEPKLAFCQEENYDDYETAIKNCGLNTKIVTFNGDSNSKLMFIKQYGDSGDPEEFEPASFDPEKVFVWLISTSGSTGFPKFAAFTHSSVYSKCMLVIEDLKNLRSKPSESNLLLSPVQWISAYFYALGPMLFGSIKLQTSAPATAEHVIDIINQYKPVSTMMGPSLVTQILHSDKKCDLTCFNTICVSGSKCPPNVLRGIQARLRSDAKIFEMYGQTEGLGTILKPNFNGPVGACGTATTSVQIKLVDPETDEEITGPFKTGELLYKGLRFAEYYRNPEATRKAITPDGWCRTGDLLYHDDDGYYYFVNRISLLIKYRNYQVIPAEIEEVIRQHPGVQEVCVTSVAHAEDGEHAVACVVRRAGSHVTAHQIEQLVASNFSHSQQLHGGVIFMNELPLMSNGKIAVKVLKEMVQKLNGEQKV